VPYDNLEALQRSPLVTPDLRAAITAMSAAMTRLLDRAANEEESLSLATVIRPYLWRLGALVLVAALAGGWLARRAGVKRAWTAGLVALAATLLVIAFAWIVTSPPWYPLAAPVVLGGVPWALWRLARRRGGRAALQAIVVWAAASVAAVLLTL
jgi:hypothetical protein